MPTPPLPDTSAGFADASWETIATYYRDLEAVPLSAVNLETWLADWSRLDELVTEAASLAMIAYTANTTDKAKEAAHLRFSTDILPKLGEVEVALARKFVAQGSDRLDLVTTLRRFRTSIGIFREANVPLTSETVGLAAKYQQITGTMSANWGGERIPLPRLAPFLKSGDRTVREAAWRASVAPYVASRAELATLFNRMVTLRQEMARNAGFADYRDYIFQAKFRFDYTPADCQRLHAAIEATVCPAIERAFQHRSKRLGLPSLRPWDTAVDPWRTTAPVPYADIADFQESSARIFTAIDPALGAQFGS